VTAAGATAAGATAPEVCGMANPLIHRVSASWHACLRALLARSQVDAARTPLPDYATFNLTTPTSHHQLCCAIAPDGVAILALPDGLRARATQSPVREGGQPLTM